MSSLKSKVISNVAWNLVGHIFSRGLGIVTTIVLAWFLVPEDYALVAMLAVFIALSTALVDAGLGQTLIRKLKVSQLELNTVFYTNLGLSIILYITLYGLAPLIAGFYSEERLIELIRVVSLAIFFQAFTVVQKTLLIRSLNFKLQVRIILPAAILSSVIAILLAYLGYGVWALIFQILFNSVFLALFYWILRLWKPSFQFSFLTLKSLWKFSGFLVIDSLAAIPFQNMYLIVLPKYFATGVVGLYFFSQKVVDVVATFIISSIQTVTYPVLSQIQDDNVRLKQGYRKVISATTFLTFPLIFFVAALSPVIFEVLLPEKWFEAANYLQLMCIAAILYPLQLLNLNILKVKDRADLVFFVGIFKKLIVIAVFVYTLQFGIYEILVGQIISSLICYIPNAYYSSKLINYSIREQFKDFLPSLLLSGMVAGLVYYLQFSLSLMPIIELFSLIVLAICLYLMSGFLLKLHAFQLVKELCMNKIKISLKNKY